MADQSQRGHHRSIAVRAMRERGLDPDIPQDAQAQAAAIAAAPATTEEPTRDLRTLLWCSIDNDDSRDLDQLSGSDALLAGDVKALVPTADRDPAAPHAHPPNRPTTL